MVWTAEFRPEHCTFSLLEGKWLKLALEEGQRDLCSRDSLSSFVAKIIEVGMREPGSSDQTTKDPTQCPL